MCGVSGVRTPDVHRSRLECGFFDPCDCVDGVLRLSGHLSEIREEDREASKFARYSLTVYRDNQIEDGGDEVDEVGRQMDNASRSVSLVGIDGAVSLQATSRTVSLEGSYGAVSLEDKSVLEV